jgi:HD-GYP domain-containing protein (c-di-GMP phosphodiesterase class II)
MSIFRNKSGNVEYSDLDKFTVPELKKIAKEKMNLSISSKSKKADIIKEIKECIDSSNRKKSYSASKKSCSKSSKKSSSKNGDIPLFWIPKKDQNRIKSDTYWTHKQQVPKFTYFSKDRNIQAYLIYDLMKNVVIGLQSLAEEMGIKRYKSMKKEELVKEIEKYLRFE